MLAHLKTATTFQAGLTWMIALLCIALLCGMCALQNDIADGLPLPNDNAVEVVR